MTARALKYHATQYVPRRAAFGVTTQAFKEQQGRLQLVSSAPTASIMLLVLEARWRLFGHILRRDRNIPANKAMLFYFSDNKRARGRTPTTLPITLNNDLKKNLSPQNWNLQLRQTWILYAS
ncbi:hypothetical protein PoB_001116600 [Plakobranchus ocellatus]|uniref:Uncharacterized protein n=1 Tax=Plakobranchus ocellatus TaxID=259542 RepID=A0AAV3YMY8_9GAST|nr:hypothetical protein PoB_001116600 [Plakobranchus ocellatus]